MNILRLRTFGLYFAIFLFGASLRFYQLGDIQKPVFDEVYFPKFAYAYIEQKPFFHTHPPFAKYLIKFGIQSYYSLPWTEKVELGQIAFEELNPVSYRWVNALLGSLLLLVIARVAYLLCKSHGFALLAMGFVAIDGSMIVAARYGLSNMHVVFWGFLSLLLLLQAWNSRHIFVYYGLCAISLGLTLSVKWNGFSYWAMAMLLSFALLVALQIRVKLSGENSLLSQAFFRLKKLGGFKQAALLLMLLLLPLAVYRVVWIPDLELNKRYDFQQTHTQIFNYHSDSVESDDHPYCSRWYTWPCMWRPISYHFEKIPAQAIEGQTQIYKNVHSFGNPALYIFSAIAVIALSISILKDLAHALRHRRLNAELLAKLCIAIGFFGAWLPWALVSRCTFLYHYQSAAVFSFLALAWALTRLHSTQQAWAKAICYGTLLTVSAAFIYWLPFQLGIELSREGFYSRMWLDSWI